MLGKLNILNNHVHCEDFYADLLNLVYGYQLKNMNAMDQNADGFDLIDEVGKLLLQVSATATKRKLEWSLTRDLATYKGHGFRFVSISKDASHLRSGIYPNPHDLDFDPSQHIYDVASLLKVILHMSLAKQRQVYEFLRRELRDPDGDITLKETNIAKVINILANEDLSGVAAPVTTTAFNVDDKIAFNRLFSAAGVIEDYKFHHARVDQIYAEFDHSGANKSRSVLDAFRSCYHKFSATLSGDELFFRIVEHVSSVVEGSSNYNPLAVEELQLCVTVLAVDAFIRCKIFKNPVEVAHVAT
jgi:hypothetical protein